MNYVLLHRAVVASVPITVILQLSAFEIPKDPSFLQAQRHECALHPRDRTAGFSDHRDPRFDFILFVENVSKYHLDGIV